MEWKNEGKDVTLDAVMIKDPLRKWHLRNY